MLQRIRDRITGKLALFMLALIALPFVFFGIGTNYNFIGAGYAAKVNGDDVSVVAFENAYRNQLLAVAEQGGEIPSELRSIVRDGVLDSLIRDLLVEQYIRGAEYAVPDRLITESIQREATWQVDGEFSRDVYYQWLDQRALTPSEFEASQRDFLAQNQLQRGVAASAFVTPSEYRRYLNLYGEERQASVAEIDLAALTEAVEIDDATAQAYYDERPDDFQSSETVDISYLELNREELAAAVTFTEEELEQFYQDSSSDYLQDEQRQARHILIPFGDDEAAAEQEASALNARAQAGEPFEDLARQYSKDGGTAQSGGDLGMLLRTQLPAELGDAIFAMEEGDIQGPVRSTFGFHVIRLDDIRTGGALPLAEVRGELTAALRSEKAAAEYARLERALSDALFDAADIAALGETVGLTPRTAAGYTRSGGEPFGANQTALDEIFDSRVLEDGELSNILELDANRTVVVSVDQYHPAARRPFEDVKEGIVATLKSQRALELANERGEALQAALSDGTNFDEAAAEIEGMTTRTLAVSRQDGGVQDARLRAAVFQEKKPVPGQPRIGTVLTEDNKFAVYAVHSYAPGRPEAIPLAQRDEMKLRLGFQSGSQDLAGMVLDLQSKAEIVKSEDVLAADSVFE